MTPSKAACALVLAACLLLAVAVAAASGPVAPAGEFDSGVGAGAAAAPAAEPAAVTCTPSPVALAVASRYSDHSQSPEEACGPRSSTQLVFGTMCPALTMKVDPGSFRMFGCLSKPSGEWFLDDSESKVNMTGGGYTASLDNTGSQVRSYVFLKKDVEGSEAGWVELGLFEVEAFEDPASELSALRFPALFANTSGAGLPPIFYTTRTEGSGGLPEGQCKEGDRAEVPYSGTYTFWTC